jgi:4-amino-4-deoxy-L-arabinose transferase-like glycosyltransferase
LFLTLPLTSFYALVASTDAWLLLWWSLALFAFVIAKKTPSAWLPWLVCGVALGLGMLSKYSMALFVVSALLCFWRQSDLFETKLLFQAKPTFFKPFCAGLLALLVFLPNLIWNVQTGFPTLEHHVAISQVSTTSGGTWTFSHAAIELVSFFSAQFVVFGPWAFLSLLIVSFSNISDSVMPQRDRKAMQLLLMFVWPMLGLILLQATISRAHSNWALPAYVAGTILVAAFWVRQMQSYYMTSLSTGFLNAFLFGKRALQASVMFGLILTSLMILVPHWAQSTPALQTSHLNPLRKLQGWKQVALWVKAHEKEKEKEEATPMRVIAEERDLLAALSVYGYPEAYPPLAWNPGRQKDNHYRWFYDLANAKLGQQPMLLVLIAGQGTSPSASGLQQSFEQVRPIQDAALAGIEIGGNHRHAYAFEVRGFKGYH